MTFSLQEFIRNLKYLSYSTFVILILWKIFACDVRQVKTQNSLARSQNPLARAVGHDFFLLLLCAIIIKVEIMLLKIYSMYLKNSVFFTAFWWKMSIIFLFDLMIFRGSKWLSDFEGRNYINPLMQIHISSFKMEHYLVEVLNTKGFPLNQFC